MSRWSDCIDPRFSYRHTHGYLTNGRGLAFKLHAGTKYVEIRRLVWYLDALEKIVGQKNADELAAQVSALEGPR